MVCGVSITLSLLVYLAADEGVKKPVSMSADAGQAASWQQIFDYNKSQKTQDKTVDRTTSAEHSDTSRNVPSANKDEICRSLVDKDASPSVEVQPAVAADKLDGLVASLEHSSGLSGLSPKSRSFQDLNRPPDDAMPARHRSTDSLVKQHPALDRLMVQDAAAKLSRRRSFSGTLHKAASAVAGRYRGLRNMLKAASAELLSGGAAEELTTKCDDRATSGDHHLDRCFVINNEGEKTLSSYSSLAHISLVYPLIPTVSIRVQL